MRLWFVLVCALLLAGCGPRMPDTATVTGTVTYRERIMIPPDSVVTVRLEDVALQDVAATRISETSFQADGAPPYAFEIEYFPSQILPRGRYALRASIHHEGRLIFTTDTHVPAFQDQQIEMTLVRVRSPRPRPQYQE